MKRIVGCDGVAKPYVDKVRSRRFAERGMKQLDGAAYPFGEYAKVPRGPRGAAWKSVCEDGATELWRVPLQGRMV